MAKTDVKRGVEEGGGDSDASPSGAKAKTAEWNYSCSIVYNGRINGLNRRRAARSLFVIAQREREREARLGARTRALARTRACFAAPKVARNHDVAN